MAKAPAISFASKVDAHEWIQRAARVGYVAKGAVYTTVGGLAALSAFGFAGGRVTDTRGAIAGVGDEPFGELLLALLATGLSCFAIWRFVQAVKDPDRAGADAKGLVKRGALVVSGLVHTGLAYSTLRLLTADAQPNSDGMRQSAGWLMSHPFGIWLVGIAGIIIMGAGAFQIRRAVTGSFCRQWETAQMSAREHRWATRISAGGIAARGVALGLIGWFFIRAALEADPSEAQGLRGALSAFAAADLGWLWLGAIGVGFMCYGAYCFINGRYKRIRL